MQKRSRIPATWSRNSDLFKDVLNGEYIPITYSFTDHVYVFYTPQGKYVSSTTYEEAHAKWLLTKETD